MANYIQSKHCGEAVLPLAEVIEGTDTPTHVHI